jgi:hypothetical protein
VWEKEKSRKLKSITSMDTTLLPDPKQVYELVVELYGDGTKSSCNFIIVPYRYVVTSGVVLSSHIDR